MATFQRFEEIQVWQKARHATKNVYEITKNEIFSRDFGLANQFAEHRFQLCPISLKATEENPIKTSQIFWLCLTAQRLKFNRIYT